jgi:hypothetical protein
MSCVKGSVAFELSPLGCVVEITRAADRAREEARRRDVGDRSLMRVFDRKSVFRLGLFRVFVRASVGGVTGHSAISRKFPCRGLASTHARYLSGSVGWRGGWLRR